MAYGQVFVYVRNLLRRVPEAVESARSVEILSFEVDGPRPRPRPVRVGRSIARLLGHLRGETWVAAGCAESCAWLFISRGRGSTLWMRRAKSIHYKNLNAAVVARRNLCWRNLTVERLPVHHSCRAATVSEGIMAQSAKTVHILAKDRHERTHEVPFAYRCTYIYAELLIFVICSFMCVCTLFISLLMYVNVHGCSPHQLVLQEPQPWLSLSNPSPLTSSCHDTRRT